MIRILQVIALLSMLGCNNQQKENKLESRLNNLEQENKALKEKLNRVPQVSELEAEKPVDTIFKSQYAFTRLVVEQEEYDFSDGHLKTEAYNVCSSIEEFSNVDNDLRYKLLDQAQQKYLTNSQHKKGSVKSRDCFVFLSYEEASKKREEFLISK